ncbi:hypothetical protein JDS81_23345, partial [Bacillus cereus group sp. N31]|uniref:hypothetical protein n=1 Tax=Bacillus cereus group sp. N31 TaxID=2794594 RepID=UPI0018F4E431
PQDVWSEAGKIAKDVLPTVLPALISILAAGPNQLQLEGVWNNTLKPSGAAVPVLTSLLSNN